MLSTGGKPIWSYCIGQRRSFMPITLGELLGQEGVLSRVNGHPKPSSSLIFWSLPSAPTENSPTWKLSRRDLVSVNRILMMHSIIPRRYVKLGRFPSLCSVVPSTRLCTTWLTTKVSDLPSSSRALQQTSSQESYKPRLMRPMLYLCGKRRVSIRDFILSFAHNRFD